MPLVRDPATPPQPCLAASAQWQFINFRHPGYRDGSNHLLRLFASDIPSSGNGCGLHAAVALTACGIVAGDRWDGWLSEHKDPGEDESQRIYLNAAGMDKILEASCYYFHLPPTGRDLFQPYPIVPTFQEWLFPHGQLPPSWIQHGSKTNWRHKIMLWAWDCVISPVV